MEGLDVVLQSALAGEVARALCAIEHLDLAVHARVRDKLVRARKHTLAGMTRESRRQFGCLRCL